MSTPERQEGLSLENIKAMTPFIDTTILDYARAVTSFCYANSAVNKNFVCSELDIAGWVYDRIFDMMAFPDKSLFKRLKPSRKIQSEATKAKKKAAGERSAEEKALILYMDLYNYFEVGVKAPAPAPTYNQPAEFNVDTKDLEIADLKAQVASLTREVQKLTSEVLEVKRELDEANQIVRNQKQQIAILMSEHAEVSVPEEYEADTELINLRSLLAAALARVDKLKDKNADLQKTLDARDGKAQKLLEANRRIGELETQLEDARDQIGELSENKELAAAKLEIDDLLKQVRSLNERIEELTDDDYETKLEESKKELRSLRDENAVLRSQVERLQASLEDAEASTQAEAGEEVPAGNNTSLTIAPLFMRFDTGDTSELSEPMNDFLRRISNRLSMVTKALSLDEPDYDKAFDKILDIKPMVQSYTPETEVEKTVISKLQAFLDVAKNLVKAEQTKAAGLAGWRR